MLPQMLDYLLKFSNVVKIEIRNSKVFAKSFSQNNKPDLSHLPRGSVVQLRICLQYSFFTYETNKLRFINLK